MAKEYIYATGKRKSSIARVNITPGTGKITVNKKDINEVFNLETLKAIILKPFITANLMEKYDVETTVHGGGFAGQAGAIAHGISKALASTDLEVRTALKKEGLLTRDSRVKERRKYGLKKARKAPQFSKR
ncbi:MAG: 30S ribosomal protein S9 [Clostridia bacterium]|nr:30S ribosomal protein S9 [Clostridia bacterium]MDD4386171.1 30S ribosomal protein S9 [Clostridia bacterium]